MYFIFNFFLSSVHLRKPVKCNIPVCLWIFFFMAVKYILHFNPFLLTGQISIFYPFLLLGHRSIFYILLLFCYLDNEIYFIFSPLLLSGQ